MNQTKLTYNDRPSWLNQMGSFGSILILLLMPFFLLEMTPFLIAINILAALVIILTIVYSRFAWEFRIGDGDVQSQHGITSKKQESIPLKSIKDIEIKQTTIQRFFDVGDVEFSTAGSINNRIVFRGIKSPFALRDRVLQIQRKQKKTRKRR
ncbi:MAG: PH domain-containing protein [Mariprofundaceae bacterium]|nr:PH domain-containing protein [Mariprofundaceae bacterium]